MNFFNFEEDWGFSVYSFEEGDGGRSNKKIIFYV